MTATEPADSDRYDAFVSYRRTDIDFARRLEKALNAYRPPATLTVPQRRLRVFRDEGDLTGTEYFKSIDRYLARCDKLIVICSPAARESPYVDDEIRRFIGYRGAEHLIPVLLAGLPNNEAGPEQASEQAFPQALCEALQMPLAINYRGFNPAREKVNRGAFEGSWYTLLATLYDRGRDEIEQREHVRRRRRRNVLAALAGSATAVFAVLAALAWWQKLEADDQRDAALRGLAKYLASVADDIRADKPQSALLLAVEAVRTTRDVDGTVITEAQAALHRALASAAGAPLRPRGGLLSPGGHRFAALDRDRGRLDVWSLAAPEAPPTSMNLKAGAGSIIAFSDDARWMVLSEGPGEIVVWNVDTPSASAVRLGAHSGSEAKVHGFSPDARWLAMSDDTARVYLWRLADLAVGPVILAGHKAHYAGEGRRYGIGQVAFDPSSTWVSTSGWDGTSRMWNLSDSAAAPQILGPVHVSEPGFFSADGQWFAQLVQDEARGNVGRLGLWRLGDGHWNPVPSNDTLPQEQAQKVEPGRILGFLPRNLGVVTALDNEVRLWRLDTTTSIDRAIPGKVATLSPDGTRLATVSDAATGVPGRAAYTVRVYDLTQPANDPASVTTVDAWIKQLRFDPHNHHLAVVTQDGRLRVFPLESAERAAQLMRGADTPIEDVRFSADGRWLLATPSWGDFAIRVWRLENPSSDPVQVEGADTPELTYKSSSGGGGGEPVGGLPDGIAVDPRGRWMVVPGKDNTALLVDLQDPAATPRRLGGHGHAVTAAIFASNGDWLATADWNHAVRLWRLPGADQPMLTLERAPNPVGSSVSAIAVSPDGARIATGGAAGEVALWKLASAEAGPRMLGGHEGWITSLAFSPDGTRLLSAAEDGKIQLWRLDAAPTEKAVSLDAHRGAVIKARFFDDGRRIITAGTDALVRLWTVADLTQSPVSLREHEGDISAFDLDPGNRWLVTGSLDGTVRLWDLQAVDTTPALLGPRKSAIHAVAISPDASVIAAGDQSGEVRIWRRAEPNADPDALSIGTDLRGGTQRASAWGLRFSRDGRWLTTMAAGKLTLWRVKLDERLALACHIAGRNLTYEDWQAHLDRIPYRLTCNEEGLPSGWMDRADALAKRGDIAAATARYAIARTLERAATVDPVARARSIAVKSALDTARSLARSGERDAALVAFANVRRLDPKIALDPAAETERTAKAHTLMEEASRVADSGALDEAIRLFRQARALDDSLDIDPEAQARRRVAPLLVRRGDELAREGRTDEAIAEYERAIADQVRDGLDPHERAHHLRADALLEQARAAGLEGNLERATQLFQQALAHRPALRIDPVAEGRKSVVAHRIEQANRLVLDSQLLEAAALFRQILEFDPKASLEKAYFNELCWEGVQRDLAGQMLDICDLAVAQRPGDGAFRDSRGVARALTNDTRGAIEDFKAYVEWASQEGAPTPALTARKRWIRYLGRGGRVRTFAQLKSLGGAP
jgi:WD40 repeat protein